MRVGEITTLRWGSVDLQRRVLTVESQHAKSRSSRTIPLSTWLEEVLRSLAEFSGARPGTLVFMTSDGKSFDHWQIRRRLNPALAACKAITDEKKPKVTTHVLRHTAASLMVAAGVPIFDVAKIFGHSTVQVTMRYAHFAPEAGRAAIDALDRRLRPGPPASGGGEPPGGRDGPLSVSEGVRHPLRYLAGGMPSITIQRGTVVTGQSTGQSRLAVSPGPT